MNDTKHFALVTGTTGGIGLELAKLLAKDNFNLIIVARDEETQFNSESSQCKRC